MQTWKEMMQSGGLDSYNNYVGSREHENFLVFAVQCRELRSFAGALRFLGGESPDVQVHRFDHWAVGWVEMILINPEATELVKKAEKRLQRDDAKRAS